MKLRASAVLTAIVLALVTAGSCAATTHFALATSRTNIYLLRQGSTWSSGQSAVPLYNEGSSLSGVAVKDNWVYATDAVTNQLIVGRIENVLGNPTLSHVKAIDLSVDEGAIHKEVSRPTSVVIDSSGGVYVIGSEKVGGVSNYAYVTASDWTGSANVAIGSLDSHLVDIAALSAGGAVIASDKSVARPLATCMTRVSEGSPGTTGPVNGTTSPTSPSAIAADGTKAYIISHVGQNEPEIRGTLEIVDTDTGTLFSSVGLPVNLDPHDIAVFSTGGKKYLAIIGVTRGQKDVLGNDDNNVEAWRVELNSSGLPIGTADNLDDVFYEFTGETAGGQKIAFSEDGEVFWSVHPGAAGAISDVYARSASSWTASSNLWTYTPGGYAMGNIAAYNFVPEPSSILALSTFAGALLLNIRRRKR